MDGPNVGKFGLTKEDFFSAFVTQVFFGDELGSQGDTGFSDGFFEIQDEMSLVGLRGIGSELKNVAVLKVEVATGDVVELGLRVLVEIEEGQEESFLRILRGFGFCCFQADGFQIGEEIAPGDF